MGKKEGQKNGGDNKVAPAPAENKDDVWVTAVYKIGCNCHGCAKKVKKALRHFDDVELVKLDCGAIKVTVKGTNVDPTAIREKLEKKLKKKKVELVSPQPKKEGSGGGGNKKPEEKKAEKKEEREKPKEKEGEKNGGDNKVAPAPVPAEKNDDVSVTAIYKIDCNCEGCTKILKQVKKAVSDFDGVEVVKTDCGAIKWTVKGTNIDPTAIREKLEEKIEKKVELVSPHPKKGGGGGGRGGDKKLEEKKAEKKEEPKKPKEKEGEKNGGDNKVAPAPVPAEKKDDVSVTAVYKINCNCDGWTKKLEKVKKAVLDFNGVEVVKTDCGAIKWTVKGTNIDPTAIREKLEEKIEKKVELVSPHPKKGGGSSGRSGDKKPEKKKAEKKEEPKKPKEKEGEKNSGDSKVAPAPVPAEKKDDVSVTAVYKIDCNCEGCTKTLKKVKKAVSDFDGVEVVKTDCGAIKWTVKGTNIDPTAIREKLEEKIEKKVELVSPHPKKGGGGSGRGSDKKPEEKKAEKKEEPKKPKEKEGEKNGGDNKVAPAPVPAEKKDDVSVTAIYKIDCNCDGWTKKLEKVKKAVLDFNGVEEVKTDGGAYKLTVKGTNVDLTAIREKLEEEMKKKVELVSPQPKKDGGGSSGNKKPEEKKAEKKEEPKIPKKLRDELFKETPQLASVNLENEPRIMELRNQCRKIRTTELAAAQEKLNELERKKESLLQRLQDAMNKTEEESENLHKQLLDRDVDLGTFVQKYKKLRNTYHRCALIQLSAKTSSIG